MSKLGPADSVEKKMTENGPSAHQKLASLAILMDMRISMGKYG